MGFLDSLFGKPEPPKPKKKKKQPVAAATETAGEAAMVVHEGINPEIIAVITASIYAMMGTGNLAVRITRANNQWAAVGRQKLMDSRQFV